MAGFFGLFDYSKPGPGISKNAPQKKRFFVFFEIFFRKFSQLVVLNLLYAVSCLPVITIGPATAGFTYILRNFSREEHAFLWMDYRDTIKKNWKQSLAVSFINAFLAVTLYVSIDFWHQQYLHSVYMIVPFAFCVSAALIFVFMQYYLYVMIVTFHLSLKQLYKNAFLFSFLGILPNLLLSVLLGVIGFGLYLLVLVIPFVGILVVLLIALSFFGLLINFCVWPVIKKYMVDPYYAQHPEELTNHKEENVFSDVIPKKNSDYGNGKRP